MFVPGQAVIVSERQQLLESHWLTVAAAQQVPRAEFILGKPALQHSIPQPTPRQRGLIDSLCRHGSGSSFYLWGPECRDQPGLASTGCCWCCVVTPEQIVIVPFPRLQGAASGGASACRCCFATASWEPTSSLKGCGSRWTVPAAGDVSGFESAITPASELRGTTCSNWKTAFDSAADECVTSPTCNKRMPILQRFGSC